MTKGSRRNGSDVAIVSTGLKGTGNSGGGYSDIVCPTSLRIKVNSDFRHMTGMHARAQLHGDDLVGVFCGNQKIAEMPEKRGATIAKCIAIGYKYEGVLVLEGPNRLYVELRIA